MKHSSLIQYSPRALQDVSEAIAVLTEAEGLPSHGESVSRRMQSEGYTRSQDSQEARTQDR